MISQKSRTFVKLVLCKFAISKNIFLSKIKGPDYKKPSPFLCSDYEKDISGNRRMVLNPREITAKPCISSIP